MTDHSNNSTSTNSNHGSISSYVAGFVLSILLTITAFYMVKNQVLNGNILIVVVLGLAFLQMTVQMIFFLHLGRGPKPLYNIVFLGATAGMILLVVGASILIMDNLYRNMSPTEVTMRLAQDENIAEINGKQTGACQGNNANHEAFISEAAGMLHITANRCDTITFKSGDGLAHELMFGAPDRPVSYGGLDEVFVRNDRAKIITLNEVGDFSFHDMNNPAIVGHFSVTETHNHSEHTEHSETTHDHSSHSHSHQPAHD